MKEMGEKLKDKNKQSNYRELFLFVVRSHVFFQSFGVHKNMCVDIAIEKLQKITREKEA
jgi:hypothetical protein